MNTELVQTLTSTFEAHAQQTEGGIEYWLARDLQPLLGCDEWRNFNDTAISKAKTACEVSGHSVADHFVDVNKMVELGSGSQRQIEDIMLTRSEEGRPPPGLGGEADPGEPGRLAIGRLIMTQKRPSPTRKDSLTVARRLPAPAGRRAGDEGAQLEQTIAIRSRRPGHYAVVVACVSSDACVAESRASVNGAKMPRANWNVLEKFQVVIPKGKVAEKFSALFADIIAQQQTLIFQIQNLRWTRNRRRNAINRK